MSRAFLLTLNYTFFKSTPAKGRKLIASGVQPSKQSSKVAFEKIIWRLFHSIFPFEFPGDSDEVKFKYIK